MGQFQKVLQTAIWTTSSRQSIDELLDLKQVGTVVEYQKNLPDFVSPCNNSTCGPTSGPLHSWSNLTENIQLDVGMQNPPNLVTTMNLGRAFERKQQLGKHAGQCKSAQFNSKPPSMSTANSGAASKKPLSNMDSSSPPFIKQLSQAKMAARRAKGLCYNYDESCSFGHQCEKLFQLEVADSVEGQDDFENTTPAISLNAITRLQNSTMQLVAKVRGSPIKVLVHSRKG